MRKKIRILLIVGIFLSLGVVGYKVGQSIWRQKLSEVKRDPKKLLDHIPDATLQIKKFHRSHVEGGKKIWEVAGEEAQYLKEKEEALIKKPRIVFYQNGGSALEAEAKEGHLFFANQDIKQIQLREGIKVSFQNYVLKTEEVSYIKETNQLNIPGKVTLEGDGLEVEGVGMEILLQDEKIRLLKNVRTKFYPEKLNSRFSNNDKLPDKK